MPDQNFNLQSSLEIPQPINKSENFNIPDKNKEQEKKIEQINISDNQKKEQKLIEKIQAKLGQVGMAGVIAQTQEEQKEIKEVENIMAQGLSEFYTQLPRDKQLKFKEKGEETARLIHKALKETKLKIGKIIKLLSDWLKLIPGVNRFFLEQSTKIKADELAKLKRDW